MDAQRIVIAGCRDFDNYDIAKICIEHAIFRIRSEYRLIFFSGGCRGADRMGERFARENGFEVRYFFANWKLFGRSAGPIRNEQMARNCDCVICFWDGRSRGTKNMIDLARQYGKKLRVYRLDQLQPNGLPLCEIH